jgi:glutamate racemase
VTPARVLLFDSGMGGLTVARAVAELVYAADNAAFPYGAWKEEPLVARILAVIGRLIDRVSPDLVVVACNTASTLALARLREAYAVPFVGTVPAIKPAAAQTRTGVIGVLATPGTVAREYTHALIHTFAYHCKVILHGAPSLAEMAERKLAGAALDPRALAAEVAPVFREEEGRKTDVVVLGCTHYPLILPEIVKVAPWPVTWIDPAPAIARRAGDLLDETPRKGAAAGAPGHGTVILTGAPDAAGHVLAAYAAMGFATPEFLQVPVIGAGERC